MSSARKGRKLVLLTGCGVLLVLLAASWFYWDRIMAWIGGETLWEGAARWSGNRHIYEVVVVPGGVDWPTANRRATEAGGYLATIASQAENNFLIDLVDRPQFWASTPAGTLFGPWLGAMQAPASPEPNGNWQWVTGEPFSFANWAEGPIKNPNDAGGIEDRICFIHFARSGRWGKPSWSDEPASKRLSAYIVEYDRADQRRGALTRTNLRNARSE